MGVGAQRHTQAALPPGKRAGTHCSGIWLGPRAGMNRCGISRPRWYSKPGPPAHSYTDWAILVHGHTTARWQYTRTYGEVWYRLSTWKSVIIVNKAKCYTTSNFHVNSGIHPHSQVLTGCVTRHNVIHSVRIFLIRYSQTSDLRSYMASNEIGIWQEWQKTDLRKATLTNFKILLLHGLSWSFRGDRIQ